MTDIRRELERLIALNHAEQWVPDHESFQQLLQRHGERIIPGLIECLNDVDTEIRLLATGLLEEAGKLAEPAVLALTERLSDEDRNVVVRAMFSLKRLSQFARSAIPALKVVMGDTTERYLQIVAAGSLAKIAPEDSSVIPVLIAALDDPIAIHRAAACEFLGERRHSAVLNTMKLFNDPDFNVRFASTSAYSRWTGDWLHAVAVCVQMLKDTDATHRAMGSECLLSIRAHAQDHLDLLTMAIADADWDIRLDLEETLNELRRRK